MWIRKQTQEQNDRIFNNNLNNKGSLGQAQATEGKQAKQKSHKKEIRCHSLVKTVSPDSLKPRLMRRVESGVGQQALVIGCHTCQSTRRQGRWKNLAWIMQASQVTD